MFLVMIFFILAVFMWNPTTSLSSGQLCNTSPDKDQQTLNVLFKCMNGKTQVYGCIVERGDKIYLGKTHPSDEYEMRCHKTSENYAQMIPLACWHLGQRYLPSEIMVEEPFWYTCTMPHPHNYTAVATFRASGCVSKHVHPEFADSESANRLDPGQTFQMGQYIFTCLKDNSDHGHIRIEPTACLFEGNQYSLGEEFSHGRYTYRCQRKGIDDIELRMSGCVFRGAKYEPETQYVWDGFVFECRRFSNNKLSHEVVGCVDESSRWYVGGERWIHGIKPFKYMTECTIADGPNTKALKRVVACLYEGYDGTVAILNPGCMKKIGTALIKCTKAKNDTHTVQFTNQEFVNSVTEQLALGDGFRYC